MQTFMEKSVINKNGDNDIIINENPVQKKEYSAVDYLKSAPVQKKAENNTGLPDNLKSGIESMSGISLDDVNVHYNSSKPAQMKALAYTQGTDIHVAPGQEKHLGHEAWHVVQQKQGRVAPTTQMKGVNVNDSPALEHEADVMGSKAMQFKKSGAVVQKKTYQASSSNIIQKKFERADSKNIDPNNPNKLRRSEALYSDTLGTHRFVRRYDDSILNIMGAYVQGNNNIHVRHNIEIYLRQLSQEPNNCFKVDSDRLFKLRFQIGELDNICQIDIPSAAYDYVETHVNKIIRNLDWILTKNGSVKKEVKELKNYCNKIIKRIKKKR